MKQLIRGFSLLEIIIYIALVSTILTSVTYFAWDIIYGDIKTYVKREVQQNARFSLEKMAYEIRQANAIISVSSDNKTLELDSDPENIIFYFDDVNKKITMQTGSAAPEDITSEEVEVINGGFYDRSFTYGGAIEPATENVKIMMSINYYNPEDLLEWLAEEQFETTIELQGE